MELEGRPPLPENTHPPAHLRICSILLSATQDSPQKFLCFWVGGWKGANFPCLSGLKWQQKMGILKVTNPIIVEENAWNKRPNDPRLSHSADDQQGIQFLCPLWNHTSLWLKFSLKLVENWQIILEIRRQKFVSDFPRMSVCFQRLRKHNELVKKKKSFLKKKKEKKISHELFRTCTKIKRYCTFQNNGRKSYTRSYTRDTSHLGFYRKIKTSSGSFNKLHYGKCRIVTNFTLKVRRVGFSGI